MVIEEYSVAILNIPLKIRPKEIFNKGKVEESFFPMWVLFQKLADRL